MGYDVTASVNGSVLEIHRYTQALNFDATGVVNGFGNFSKYSCIKGFAGVRADELSSSTKPGRLGLSDKIILRSKEGPVVISAKLWSGINFISNETSQNETQNIAVSEHGDVNVDEKWWTYFANQKKIIYSGPEIRFREAYENNGDLMANTVDSWALSRDSLYRASINRTLISANLTSQGNFLRKHSNKSSSYLLDLKTIGSLAHLDVIQIGPCGELANRVSQDFVGQQNMSLKINMGDWIHPPYDDYVSWLNCCPIGKAPVELQLQVNQSQGKTDL
ncbi:MAG: hypothetical protein JW999_03945 [Methanotrichaceae archaeon]|nr:hypothetical protein [Methanotrichaceae archaeon]